MKNAINTENELLILETLSIKGEEQDQERKDYYFQYRHKGKSETRYQWIAYQPDEYYAKMALKERTGGKAVDILKIKDQPTMIQQVA